MWLPALDLPTSRAMTEIQSSYFQIIYSVVLFYSYTKWIKIH